MTEILDADEQRTLAQHENTIRRGLATFVEVGNALVAISEQRLYRAEFTTFEDYCRDRWGFSRQRAYQLTAAAQTATTIVDSGLPSPANEGQARELARVPEPERVEVWREVVERTDGKPTAAAIRDTYTARTTADMLAGDDWLETDEDEPEDLVTLAGLETVTPTVTVRAEPEPAKPKRAPFPDAFAAAARDYNRAAEKLARLTEDDRFARNREATHHQLSDLVRALEDTAKFLTATHPAQAAASEEARRWWATSLHKTSDALTDVANSLEQEQP